MYKLRRKLRKNKKVTAFKRSSAAIIIFLSIIFLCYYLITDVFKIKDPILSPLSLNLAAINDSFDSQLIKSEIKYKDVKKGKDFYSVELVDNGTVIFSQNKDIEKQISSLQLILSRLTIEGKRFKSLDFRFDKPVLVF